MNLEHNECYKMTMPNGKSTRVKLVEIKSYSTFPSDYIFEYLPNAEKHLTPNALGQFPIPSGLIPHTEFEKINAGTDDQNINTDNDEFYTKIDFLRGISIHDSDLFEKKLHELDYDSLNVEQLNKIRDIMKNRVEELEKSK